MAIQPNTNNSTEQFPIAQSSMVKHMLQAYEEGTRLVAPLLGFPGLSLRNANIKLAQQNCEVHYKILKLLALKFHPDMMFPLMDLSVEANALGRYTVFPIEDSAVVPRDEFDLSEIENWRQVKIGFDGRLSGYVELQKLLSIGMHEEIIRGAYVSGPYSLAALIMSADKAALATVMNPEDLQKLLEFCTDTIQNYVRMLIAAGAQVICVLEPTAVMLSPQQFHDYSAQYVRHIAEACKYNDVEIIYHVCGNSMHLIDIMADAKVNGLSIDSPRMGIDIEAATKKVPQDIAVIGNLNPTGTILRGTPDQVREETETLLKIMDPYPNFILSTGCDLPEDVPHENIAAFIKTGRNHRIVK